MPSALQVALADVKAEKLKRPEAEVVEVADDREEMPAAPGREWFRTYPNIPLMNAYGPTECSDDVTLGPICEAPDELRSACHLDGRSGTAKWQS